MDRVSEKTEQFNHTVVEYFRITLGYKDLYGSPLSLDEAKVRLGQYPLEQVLGIIGTIDGLLTLRPLREMEEGHRSLVNRMLTSAQKVDVRKHIETQKQRSQIPTPPFILFHELQLLNVLKLALSSCNETGPKREDLGPLMEAMMIINDHLMLPAVLPETFNQLDRNQQREHLIGYFVPNAVFHQGTRLLNLLARWYDLLFVDAPSLSVRSDYVDLRQALTSVTGIEADLFYWIASAFVSHFLKPFDEIIQRGVPRLNPREWFKDLTIIPEEYGLVLQELSTTAAELREELSKRADWEPYYFLPIQRRPLLQIGDLVVCLSRRFLAEKVSSGLYHLLLTGLPTGHERDKFLSFFGLPFECYVNRLFSRIFPPTDLAGRHYANPKGQLTNRELIDAVLDYGNALVLIEAKATLFSLAALVSGEATEIERKLEDIVYDASKQLDAAIKAVKNGQLEYLGINPGRIKIYLPLIVTLQFLPSEPLLYNKLQSEISARGYLQGEDIAPFQAVYIEDLEWLEIAMTSGRSLSDLLWEKISNERWKIMTFGNFLIEQAPEIFNSQNQYLLGQFQIVTQEMSAFFKSREKSNLDG